MGRLACASDGDVAHRDDGQIEGLALQQSDVEEHVPDSYAEFVDPAER